MTLLLLAVLGFAVLGLSTPGAYVHAANEVSAHKRELAAVKSELRALQKEYRNTRQERGSVAQALAQSERAISDAARSLHELDAKLARSRATLTQLDTDQRALETRVKTQQQRLAAHLRAAHRQGDDDALKTLLAGGDPNQTARTLRYLARLNAAQTAQISALRSDLNALAALHQQTAEHTATLATLRAQRQREQAQLKSERGRRASTLAALSRDLTAQQTRIGALQRDEKALTALIDRLNQILARRAAAQRAAAKRAAAERAAAERAAAERATVGRAGSAGDASPPAASRAPVAINRDTPDRGLPTGRFARLKGALRLPVAGELMNRFGAPRAGSGIPWKGLFIRAPQGQPVKAIATGEVVFAEWMRGFGNLIVVDHGDGYMSLYSNNDSLYKRVGDRVQPGDTLATVGNTGGQPDTGLYFELRHQSRPINPMNWVR